MLFFFSFVQPIRGTRFQFVPLPTMFDLLTRVITVRHLFSKIIYSAYIYIYVCAIFIIDWYLWGVALKFYKHAVLCKYFNLFSCLFLLF